MEDLDSMMVDSNDASAYLEDYEDEAESRYMMAASAQPHTRKIKPIKHPGLVLKTPIAYQSTTDPSVIPIQKDGMGMCTLLSVFKIGVVDQFY